MKKVLSLVLALVMVLGSFSMVSAASYSDVTGTTVESAVDRLSLLGILEGYPDGSFKPEGSITRAEFAAVAVRAKGLEAVAQAAKGLPTGFKDVAATSWMSGYVGTAGKLGIVNGVGNGMFAPDAPVKYEEAVTMIVRALGYEAAAQSRGGYPYGYLIVANENGLLDAVKGTQGVAATRGLVAQLTDNALEIPMMVQVGFGSEVKWVVSGSKEHGGDEKYLLDEMGFDTYEGRVTSVNTKRNEITLDNEDADLKLKDKTVKVAKEFDFYSVEGLTIKAWYSNDTVILYTVKDEAKFDAVEYDEKNEVTLVTEDENYEVARDAVLMLDGESVKADKFDADYAKVVLNDDDEIVWAEGFSLDGFILVEEVKDDVIIGYGDDELKIKDFTIVKEGKTILAADLEDGDIVFFNADEDFAVVSNNGKEGNLDRVYSDATFRFEGSAYSLSTLGTAMYFDEGKTGELVESILKDFLDDEVEVTVYVDFAGKVVLVSGEVNSVGNSAYGVLLNDATVYSGRKGNMVALDLRNGANEKVSYDILVADLGSDVKLTNITAAAVTSLKKANDVVLKVTVNKDGDVTGLELPESVELSKTFDIGDANAKGTDGYSYKLQSSSVVFYDSNKKATTLGNAKDAFKEVKAGATIYIEKGRVIAVVGDTDADADTKNVTGLVTGVKAVSGGKLQFTVKVFGVTQRLLTESKTLNEATHITLYKDKIVTFEVGETSDEIKDFVNVNSRTLKISSISGRTITPVSGTAVELNNNAVIYDSKLEAVNLKDLKKDMTITVYFQGSSNRFVDYVMAGSVNVVTPETSGVVTYIDTTNSAIYVDGVPYIYDAGTVVKSPKGSIITVGKTNIESGTYKLAVNDEVTDIKITDGIVTSLVATKIATVQTAAVTAVINTLNSNELNPAHADFNKNGNDVTSARSAYNGLTAPAPAQKDYVTNYAKLVAAEAALASVDGSNLATDKAALAVGFTAGDSATSVTGNVTLAAGPLAKGTTVAWASDDAAINATNGNVTRPTYTVGDKTVKLTATLTNGAVTDTKEFIVVVKANAPDDDESITLDKAALTIAGDLNNVVDDLTLSAAGANGTTITWATSNASIITTGGVVARPSGANVQVTLTASIDKGTGTQQTKVFYVTVLGE